MATGCVGRGVSSSPTSMPHLSQSMAESMGSPSSSSTTYRDISTTPPLPPTSSMSSYSSREATSTPPTSENFDLTQSPIVDHTAGTSIASTPEAIPKADAVPVKSTMSHDSPVFTPCSGKDLADSASPISPQCSQGGGVEVAEVAEMFSGLSLSPASLQKQEEMDLVCGEVGLVMWELGFVMWEGYEEGDDKLKDR